MQKKLTTAWTVAVLLGICLVIALIVLWNDSQTIKDLQSPAKQNISAQQDIIRADCSATDPDSRVKCADDLQALSDLLAQFSKNLPAPASAKAPVQPQY